MKKILLVFAHPDDESFAVSRTVSRYAKSGWGIARYFATDVGHQEGKLAILTPGTLEDPIFRAMDIELPDVVITMDKTGINNDPDHIKTCYAATYAFQKYAAWLEGLQKKFRLWATSKHDEAWFKRVESMVRARIEPKLYYACVPASTISQAVRGKELPKESFDVPWRGTPDDQITTVIDEEYFALHMEGTKEYFMGKNDRILDGL
ncbi:MAG: hypothetical protein Q8L37_01285 [Candidatus Gottesmanbacteria bacterium]|nr:hypothetical protein [Candidatus Gottesmanbacteria bacterium]